MIYGHMYWLRETKLSVLGHVHMLIEIHSIENIKHVLVNKLSLDKEITVDGIKIKPDNAVLMNHFWFIQENNSKK